MLVGAVQCAHVVFRDSRIVRSARWICQPQAQMSAARMQGANHVKQIVQVGTTVVLDRRTNERKPTVGQKIATADTAPAAFPESLAQPGPLQPPRARRASQLHQMVEWHQRPATSGGSRLPVCGTLPGTCDLVALRPAHAGTCDLVADKTTRSHVPGRVSQSAECTH